MSDDLLITPGSRKQEFKDSAGNVDAKIETDSSGNLKITNAGGDIEIGDTSSDVYIGDGTNSVDIVFEQDGSIRGTSGVTLTLGASGSSVTLASDLSLGGNDLTNVGDLTVTGNLNITGDINSASVTDLDVTDKTITVGVGQNEASSGGSGLIVAGSGAQMLWDETDNRFEFNKNVYTTGQWQGNGSGLNTLNASNISSGTIADARLSSRVFLGNNSGTISGNNSQSFDDKTANGIHYVSNWQSGTGTTNGPSHEGNAYGWGMLRVTQFINDANYVVQEYIPHNDDGAFIRVKWNGTWGPWRQSWTSRNDGASSGLDADKLDGQHGSYYAAASSIPSVGNGTLTISTSGIVSGGGTFTANQSGNTSIAISASESDTLDSVTDRGNTTPNQIGVGGASIHTTGGTHGLITNSFSIHSGSSDLMYIRPSVSRGENGFFQWQTYSGANGGDIELQPYGGSVTITTGSGAASTGNGLRFSTGGTYVDGRYQHRFRKHDKGGGIPLYIDTSESTANSFTELARFGTYTGNSYEFEVQGDINATGAVYSNGSAVLTSHQSLSAYAPIADPTFTGDLNMPNKLRHVGDTNTYIQFHAADQFRVVAGGAEVTEWRSDRMQMNGKSVTWDNWDDFSETALTGFGHSALNAPIRLPSLNVGTTNKYLPFLQGNAQHGSGYITSYVFGAYKRAVLDNGTTNAGWGDGHSGFFMGMGGSDSSPTEEFRFSWDGKIWHSGSGSGNTYIDYGDSNVLKFVTNGTQRMEITAGGTTFDDNVNIDSNQLENIGNAYFNEYLYHTGDTDTYIRFETNSMKFRTGGGDRLQVTNSTVTVNADLDLAAENTTGDNSIHLPRGGEITFYGDGSSHHSIASTSNSNSVTDDMRISSYGAVYVDLDSNANNTSGADFVVSRHDATAHLFKVDGETGAGKGIHSYPNAGADGVSLSSYAQGTVPINQGVVQVRSVGKTGWDNGDEMGSIDWYNSDGSGVAARNLARIVAVNSQGNGTSTTTFNGELHFYTSPYNSQLNAAPVMRLTESNSVIIGDGTDASSHLELRPADDGSADDIQFYNGSTRMGEIGTLDTSWLRINQHTGKNIYTPRYIRADNGFFVDGSSKGINGSGNFIGGTITGASDANVSNWDTAHGWGNHASAGYLTSHQSLSAYLLNTTDNFTGNLNIFGGNNSAKESFINVKRGNASGLWLKFQTDGTSANNVSQFVIRRSTDSVDILNLTATNGNIAFVGSVTASGGNSGNWNTAHGWGNHASAGYLTSHQSLSAYAPIANPTFTGDLNMPSKLRHVGDTNTYIQFHAADQWRVVTGGTERLEVNNSAVTAAVTVSAPEFDLPSGGMLDWANGDARIVEGLVNNYSLSFQTYDGSAVTTALRLDGNNNATFGGSITANGINMANTNITSVNHLTFNDAGVNEGLEWSGGSGWKIFESPDTLTNAAGNLQFVTGSTRRFGITTDGYIGATRIYAAVDRSCGYFYNDTSTRTAYTGGDFYIKQDVGNFYNYATNTYMGNSSGDTIHFRTNTVTATNWGISTGGDLSVANKIIHKGDTDTYMSFSAADIWELHCGGYRMIKAVEASSGYDYITFGGDSGSNTGEFHFNMSSGDFHADGNVIAYSSTTSSDRKLKKNIKPIEGALEKVQNLNGVSFQWKRNDKESIGFIAQEVQEVVPEIVHNNRVEEDGVLKSESLGVDYGNITALLVEAVKEQQALINRLEERIKTLESKSEK